MIKNLDAKMFCFGGIGATPDDYTREISAKVFIERKQQEKTQSGQD